MLGGKESEAAICQSLLEILHLLWDWDRALACSYVRRVNFKQPQHFI